MKFKVAMLTMMALVLAAAVWVAIQAPSVDVNAQTPNTICYMPAGGASFVCDSTGMMSTGIMRFNKELTFTVEDATPITPTGTFMPLTSAGAVAVPAITKIVGSTGLPGDLLILKNVGAQNITVSASATVNLSGDLVLAVDDTIVLIWNGSRWVELATSNN